MQILLAKFQPAICVLRVRRDGREPARRAGPSAATEMSAMGTKVCRYNWHSVGSRGWPFAALKYKCIFRNKTCGSNFIKRHSETVTVFFEITKMLIAV